MAIRNIGTTLRDHLLENKEFNYAHLVKFEKPTNEEIHGKTSEKAHTYSYLTDGAFDIVWDDLSKDAEGNLNGPQNYIASKLTKIGSVSETIEAKGSSLSMTLDAAALGSSLSTPLLTFQVDSVYGNCITTSLGNFIEEGFREGDKILISSVNTAAPNRGKYVIIKNFRDNGTKITYDNGTESGANNTLTPTANGGDYVVTLTSEELNSLILSKGATAYTTYTNREVMIYKAILDVDTNAMIGDPFLLFKGIIQNGAIKENPDKSSSVTWTLASHWGDFSRVSGRLTVDEAHRALDGSGQPDLDAVVRPEYASDRGFVHANQSLNVMALYNDIEISYKQVDINGGWPGGKRLREVENVVERRTDLAFNLSPKYLPVIYGIQKVDAIPIFVDTSNDNAAEIFVAYAICEGPVAGLLDVYIDGNSGICVDKADFDLRSGGGATVDLQCKGRMDRGDALAGYNASTGSANNFALLGDLAYYGNFNGMYNGGARYYSSISQIYQGATGTVTENATGILHEKTHTITSPIDGHFQFHAGKANQIANPTLLNKAAANGFKIQNDYFDASKRGDYWGANHRLLDTAYTVGKFTIAPGETSIPEMDFIVRGKGVECFNYDRSFNATNTVSADATNFNIGDTVSLRTSSSAYVNSNDSAAGSVTITDKWTFISLEGTIIQRFLTDYNKDISTAHYMEKTGGHKWYMAPSISTDDITSTVQSSSKTTITSSAAGSSGGVDVVIDATALWNNIMALVGSEGGQLVFAGDTRPDLGLGAFNDLVYDSSTGTFTGIASGAGTTGALHSTVEEVFIKDAIVLNSANSKPDNFYVGHSITLTRFDSAGTPNIQKRLIKSYANTGNVAIVDTEWDAGYFPEAGDSYTISAGKPDVRITLNPAMQLLDYLTSERYGRGLDLSKDIDLESFKASARACDTRSSVTVVTAHSNNLTAGDKYKYPASGAVLFSGTVESVTTRTVEGTANTFKEVVFTDVIGKLGKKWNSWETFAPNQVIWDNGSLWLMSSSGGQQTTVPAVSSSYQATSTAFSLTKVSGFGPSSIALDISKQSANGNPLVKGWVSYGGANALDGSFVGSGYGLYDSDDIKYWKYIGWDSNDQRNVTRHQMNQTVSTSNPIFDNINLMLKQFNGILRYSNGKYQLDIKSRTPLAFDSREILDETDIIGSISLKDGGVKKSHNSISTSIQDPQTKFESRSVSFFNSTYLKQDKNIPKKGSYGMPGITNYFNARFNINQMLDESRYGMAISFKMAPKGYLLLPGSIIKLNYSRFGWVDKEFRINNLVVNTDCTINVTADEHNNNAYLIKNLSKPSAGGEVQIGVAPNRNAPAPPTNLTATTSGQKGVVTLNWTNSTDFNTNFQATEIYSATVNDRAHASFAKVATVREETFEAAVPNPNETTKFYWIRHVLHIEVPVGRAGGQTITRDLGSAYAPAGATAGVTGTAPQIQDGERGPGRWNIGVSALPSSSSQAQSRWNDGTGDQPTTQVTDDQAWFFTGTESAPSGQKVWIYGGSSWTEQTEVIRGELLVDGTVTTGEIADGTILADNIDQTSTGGRFGEIVAAIGTFTQVDTDVLNANSVIAREVQVFPTGETPPTISGTTLAGAGIDLKQDGDMYIGNAAANKYMFWDQSEGTMTFRGTLDVDDITGSSATFATLMAEVATIGTLNTKMLDSDAIVTRDIRVGPSEEITAGSFVVSTEYYITDLGNTTQAQWNSVAGTSGVVYNLGSIFTAANVGTGTGKARNRTTVAKIAGATLTGAGAHLNAAGDFYVGNAATNKYMFWDQSAGTMIIRGTLDASDITAGTINADRIGANSIVAGKIAANAITADKIQVSNLSSLTANLGDVTAGTLSSSNDDPIPDANAAPGGDEHGAFLDLNNGKMVFGNASKHILFDGTDLVLSGVTIDANSIVDADAKLPIQEDATEVTDDAATLNFTNGLGVTSSGTVASIGVDTALTDKLGGIEALADVTDTTNVVGALTAGNNITIAADGTIATVADITSVVAGTGLTGGGTSGDVTLNVSGLTTTEIAADTLLIAGEAFVDSNVKLMSASAIDDRILARSTNNAGDITSVVAGAGLTGGGTSGAVTLNVSGLTTTEIAAGTLLIAGEAFADSDVKLMSASAIDDRILSYGYNDASGTVTSVASGTGLTGGPITGTGTLNVSGLTVSEFAGSSILLSTETFADNNTSLMTSGAIKAKIEDYGYTTNTGDITNVIAGTGLSDGGTSGAVTLNVTGLTVSELAATSILLSTETFADNDTSLMTSGAVKAKIENYGFSTDAGVTSVASGTGLTGGPITGTGTLNVSGLTVSEFAATSLLLSTETFADNDTSLMTSGAVKAKIEGYGYGDITSVVAGTGLTGGGTSGATTLNVVGGDGITADANEIKLDSTVVRTTGVQTIAGNKTFSNNVTVDGNLTISGTTTTLNTTNLTIEDNVIIVNSAQAGTPASTVTAGIEVERGNSANKSFLYAETGIGPSSNLAGWTFGSEKVQAGTFYGTFIGDITGTPSSLAGLTTDNLDEGTSNLYYTDARARAAITVSTGLDKSAAGAISLDLSEFTDMTAAVVGTQDELILLDNGAERRKLISEITLSDFDNDSGWTSNVGDITGVTAGTGLTGGGSSGGVTLNVIGGSGITANANNITVDSTVVRTTGSTMTAALKVGTKVYEDFETSGHFYLGNNDWGSFIGGSGNGYSATHKGMSFNNQSGIIPCLIPIDPEATYRIKLRIKQVTVSTGTGKFYFGVHTLNEDKSGLSSDTATSYNYGVVAGSGHSAGTVYTYEDTFSGYNATNTGDHQKFDPEGKYFNLIWIANYQGSGEVVIQSIEVERLPDAVWVGSSKVINSDRTITATGGTSTNWNTAHGWGNHASAGYLTSQTSHADVVVDGDFASTGLMKRGASAGTYSIVTDNSSNWNTAYGWGDHGSGGYLQDTTDTFTGALSISGDIRGTGQQLILNAGESYSYATGQTAEFVYINAEGGLIVSTSPNNWTGGWAGRKQSSLSGTQLTIDGEGLTKTNIQNFKTAYGWGDHGDENYLTSQTSHADVVVDGDFASTGLMKRGATAGSYSIVTDSSGNWDTAYGWGDHGAQSYITNSTASLAASKITSGTLANARLSTDMQLTGAAPRYRLEESGVTNTPNWWMVADGGSLSFRLNNTGNYPLQFTTNTANNAVTQVEVGYPLKLNSVASQASETSVLTIASGVVGQRDLGSNAFTSTTIPSAANNATITLAAGSGLTTGGAFTTNQGSNETINFHVGAGTGLTVNANDVAISANTLQAMARGYGWEGTYGAASAAIAESSLYWDLTEKCVVLSGDSDTSIGTAFRATRVKSGEKVRFTVTIKASEADADGMYLRLYQHNGDMPNGKTHVSSSSANGSPFVQEADSGINNWVESGAAPAAWTTYEYDYTAPADGYVSLVILNWSQMGTKELYIRQPDISKQTLALGTSSTTALAGNTPYSTLALGVTSTTALAGNTPYSTLALGITSTTALAGNTPIPAGTVTNVQVGNGLSVSSSTTTPTISLGSTLLENLGAATFTTIDTDILNANEVIISRSLRGGDLTSAAIPTGTDKGFYLDANGSLMIGNASRHLTMDTSGNVGITNLTVNDITGDVTEVLSFGPINNTLASGNNIGIDLISIPSSAYAYRPVVSASGTIMIENRDQMEVALQIRENTTTSAVSLGNVTVSTAGVNYGKYGFFNPSVTVVATSAAAFVAATVGDTVTQGSLSYIVASVSVTNSTTQVIGYYNYSGTIFSTGSNLTRGANSPAYETVGTVRVSSEDYSRNHPVPFAVQGGLTRISAESCDVRLLITKYINPSSYDFYKTSVGNFYVYDDCKNVYGTALLVR